MRCLNGYAATPHEHLPMYARSNPQLLHEHGHNITSALAPEVKNPYGADQPLQPSVTAGFAPFTIGFVCTSRGP